jgi:hypothetical protein
VRRGVYDSMVAERARSLSVEANQESCGKCRAALQNLGQLPCLDVVRVNLERTPATALRPVQIA